MRVFIAGATGVLGTDGMVAAVHFFSAGLSEVIGTWRAEGFAG